MTSTHKLPSPLRALYSERKKLLLVFALSSLLYIELSISKLFGESHFYSIVEHLVFVLYGLSSFVCSLVCARRFLPEKTGFDWSASFQYLLTSSLLNAFCTSLIFLSIRLVLAISHDFATWFPPLSGLLVNIFYTFLTVHLLIAALYLSYVSLRQQHRQEIQQREMEKHAAQANFELLQQQMTPHFLFNGLSVLSSLIRLDPERAEQFTTKFANLYRLVLQYSDSHIIALQQELNFVEEYLGLMNLRFQDAYRIETQVTTECLENRFVAPGAVQLCVENAVKHNQASTSAPLTIALELDREGQYLKISNTITAKPKPVESTQKGLNNLVERYQSLTDSPVLVTNSNNTFCVSIPLLTLLTEN